MSEVAEQVTEVAETTTTETVETTEQVEIPVYLKLTGTENDDQFSEWVNGAKEVLSAREQVNEMKAKYESELALFQTVDEEPDMDLEAIKALKKKGLDFQTANKIMTLTDEKVSSNPLKTLLLAEQVRNPEFYARNKDDIERSIREDMGLPEEGDYTPTAKLKIAALKAAEELSKMKSEVGEVKNPIKIARESRDAQTKMYAERQNLALAEATAFASELKEVKHKFGESELSLQVSKEEIDSLLKSGAASYLGYTFDTSTKEGKQALRDWVASQILIHKFQSGEFATKLVESLEAKVEKKAIQEVHNGQPVTVSRNGAAPKGEKELTATQRDLLAKGITPPSLKGKV